MKGRCLDRLTTEPKLFITCLRIKKTPQVGLEPTTPRLTAECSTIELLRNISESIRLGYLQNFIQMNCKPRIFSHTFRKWSSRIRNFVASARCVCCANSSIFYESGHLESASLTLLLGAFASFHTFYENGHLASATSLLLLDAFAAQMNSLENRSLQAQALSLLFSCSSAFFAFGQAFDRLVTVNLTHCCAYISALSTLYSARDLMSL